MSGKRCSVNFCNSCDATNKELSFHSFPKNVFFSSEWIRKCNRPKQINIKYARICSLHFKDSDYERNLKAELLNIACKKILKPDAVPSLLLPSTSSDSANLIEKLYSEIKDLKTEVEELNREKKDILMQNENTVKANNKEIEILRLEIQKLKREFNLHKIEKNDIIENFKHKIQHLEEVIKELKTEQQNFDGKIVKLFSNQFTKNQIGLIMKKKQYVRWTGQEISIAFSLRYFSKRSYVYLRENLQYPLPGISTLQRWVSKINMRKGILDEVLNFMKIFGTSLSPLERITILSFDEMKVTHVYEYDQEEDEVVGPHSYMQVIMARGLFHKWKQPIYINFDTKMTETILKGAISKLDKIAYQVVACVSDCGGGNMGLWKSLEIPPEKVFFLHPDTNKKIYVFADVPHLLKLARNWLLDTGFILENNEKITKSPLETLIQLTNTEINSCHRLKQLHIQCERSQRQNVLLAAQLLSHTTATALKFCKPGNDKELAVSLGNFIEIFDSWFDIMNAGTISSNIRKKPYMNSENQNKILNDIIHLCGTMKCVGKNSIQLFQKGILISSTSVQGLFQDLKEQYNIKYILTRRLNQDLLEIFFSQIRTRGGLYDYPSPLNALYRIRMILLGKNLCVSRHANTTSEETEFIFAAALKKARVEIELSDCEPQEDNIQEDLQEKEETKSCSGPSSSSNTKGGVPSASIMECSELDGMNYLAGFIAKKFLKENPGLGSRTNAITTNAVPSWLQHLSFGGLIEPSQKFFSDIIILERDFQNFHGQFSLRGCKNIVLKTSNYLIEKNNTRLPANIIEEFCRQRIFIRIKYLNLKLQANHLKRRTTAVSSSLAKKMRKTIN